MNREVKILYQRIKKFKNKKTKILVLENVFYVLNSFLIISLLVIFYEMVFKSEPQIRKFEFFTLVILLLTLILVKVLPIIISFIKEKSLISTAREIGKLSPDIKDELQNILELDKTNRYSSSVELIDASIYSFFNKIIDVNFDSLLSYSQITKPIKLFLLLCIILLLPNFNSAYNNSLKSILFYNSQFYEKEIVLWKINPGSKQILKGNNVVIQAELDGIQTKTIELNYKNELQSEWIKKTIISDSVNVFNAELKNINYNTRYFLSLENHKSKTYLLEAIDFPEIKSLKVKITPPKYSKLTAVFQIDNGNINALKGSKVNIDLSVSKNLLKGKIKFAEEEKNFKINGSKLSGEFIISKNSNYKFELTDSLGFSNSNPIDYSITVIKDSYPQIEIINPDKDIKLGGDNSVPFEIKLKDDFGFNKLQLKYRLSKSLYEKINEGYENIVLDINKNELEQTKYFLWKMDSLNLAASDEVSYFFEISDNDNVSGPKITKSKIYKITVPSIDEILSESDDVYTDSFNELDEALKQAEELKEEFARVENELKKKDEKLNYTEKEKIKEALEKYEKLVEQTLETNKKLNDLKEKLSENNLLSEETLKKYEELQNLFEEIGSEELQKAFQDMNKLLDQMNRKNAQNKFDQIKFNEEQFQKSLQRTINLLKRLQVEQKVENVKNRIENSINQQEEILENNNNESNEKLAKRQEQVSKSLEELEKESQQLEELMKELENTPLDEINKLNEKIEEQRNTEKSESAKNNLMQGNKNEARNIQNEIKQNMESLQQDISQIQSMMKQKNQLETLYGLMRVFNGLIELSSNQEALHLQIKKGNKYSTDYNEIIKSESLINSKLGSLILQINKIAQKSFLITPELGRAIGNSRRAVISSIADLTESRSEAAIRNTENAMSSVNESALIIKKLIEFLLSDQNSSGSGSGMSMMQQLKKMGQQQMDLNQLTSKMLQGKKLSQEQMSQMQRMAQQQELIRRSLSELNRENKTKGKSKTLSQNLDKILDDMQEVIKKMRSEDFDDEIKLKQDKILSKLLDAQKSLNERDFEDKRESVSGSELKRLSPEEIRNLKNISDELKEELIKSLKEGYSKDYENMIRRYFEQLQNKKSEN